MTGSYDRKKLAKEISKIDLQMAALAKLKKQHLARLSAPESPENQMSPEERLDALADALAEGIVYLGERGLLSQADAQVPVQPDQSKKAANSDRKHTNKRKLKS